MAAGIGDIIQSTNIKNEKEAAGYLAITQATSRIKGEKVAGAAGKTAAAYTAAGGSEAAAAATLSALSVAGVDPDGDRARTASIQLIEKSDTFFQKNRRKFGLRAADIDTPDERYALLQNDPKKASEFLKTTKFEAAMTGAVSKMFQDADTKALYARAFAANDEQAERLKAADDRAKYISEGRIQSTKKADDIIANGMGMLRIAGDTDLKDERREDVFELTRKLMGISRGNFRRSQFWLSTGSTLSEEEAVDQLSNARASQDFRLGGVGGVGGVEGLRKKYGDEHREVMRADAADEMIAELRAIRNNQNSRNMTRQK